MRAVTSMANERDRVPIVPGDTTDEGTVNEVDAEPHEVRVVGPNAN